MRVLLSSLPCCFCLLAVTRHRRRHAAYGTPLYEEPPSAFTRHAAGSYTALGFRPVCRPPCRLLLHRFRLFHVCMLYIAMHCSALDRYSRPPPPRHPSPRMAGSRREIVKRRAGRRGYGGAASLVGHRLIHSGRWARGHGGATNRARRLPGACVGPVSTAGAFSSWKGWSSTSWALHDGHNRGVCRQRPPFMPSFYQDFNASLLRSRTIPADRHYLIMIIESCAEVR